MSTDPEHTDAGDGSDELSIPYPGGDAGTLLFSGLFFGALGAGLVPMFIVASGNPIRSHEDPVWGVPATAAFILGVAFSAWAAARQLIRWWRITHGAWWLRLSASGLEINDRLGRPRHYRWSDFECFALVPNQRGLATAELAPQLTYGEKVAQGIEHGGAPVILVGLLPGFQLVPDYPRKFRHKRVNRYRNSDGVTPDGFIWEFWDRPYDQAVDLLNEWLMRYRNA